MSLLGKTNGYGRLATVALVLAVVGCGQGGGKSSSKAGQSSAPITSTAPITSSQTPPATIGSNTPVVPPAIVTSATGPTVMKAVLDDKNGNGQADPGDRIVVTFSREIRITGATAADFLLPVTGDRLGQTATVSSTSNPSEAAITLGQGAVVTVAGNYAQAVTKAGSPSGIDVASATKAIKDLQGRTAVSSRAVDIAGPSSSTTTPTNPAGPLTITKADFADVNSSGKVDTGDKITLTLSEDVVLGTGANSPKPEDFLLPVSGDDFGLAAFVAAGAKANEVVITLGASAALTVDGTFDKTKLTALSPSGIGPDTTKLTAAKLQSKAGAKPLTGDAVEVAGKLGPPAGLALTSVRFQDKNLNGVADDGDVITFAFAKDIDIGVNGIYPDVTHFLLPVAGDKLDPACDVDYGIGWNEVDLILHGTGNVITINGTFDPNTTSAGSASGIGLSPNLPAGAIVDYYTLKDVQTGVLKDIEGTLTPPKPPVLVSAFWIDRDLDGKATAGDDLVLEFSEAVNVVASKLKAQDFSLPVSGDSLGSGAKFAGGPRATELTITLGSNPVLSLKGTFDKAKLSSGSASGIDLSQNPTAGAIVSTKNANAIASATAWDLQEPLGAVDNAMSNDSVKDAALTTADWNAGNSGKVVASNRLDVGAGTVALAITKDATIDTTKGTIDGVKSPAFKGAGVFEFSSISIAKVNVTVTGTAPLVLKSMGTATVDGTFLMDGKNGGSNTVTYGGVQGMGGKAGPGGFDGGNGALGGGIDVTPGSRGMGPLAGFGGGTDTKSGGAGGAGFVTVGKAGDTGQTTGTGPGGIGGQGGPVASATQLALVPFVGGSGGGGGGALQRPTPVTPTTYPYTAPGAGGGGGGGAFRLVAAGVVKFGGKVSVNGGMGGNGASLGGGGGGGGAGGAVLLQSQADVILSPSATFSAKGGLGGTGTKGGDGSDGMILIESNGKVTQLPPAVTGTLRPIATEGAVTTLDTGASVEDLSVTGNATLDTDKGTLNGSPVLGFKGNGTFEVRNFSLAANATLSIVGTSALTLKASGNVDVAGAIDLNGEKGQDQLGLNGGLGGRGRAGGTSGGTGGSLTLSASQTVASETQPTAGLGQGAGKGAENGDAAGGAGGSYATNGSNGMGFGKTGVAGSVYGSADLKALSGGSGGGGGAANKLSGKYLGGGGGGAGGGALAIHAKGDIKVSGAISANGGNGGLSARGGNGGAGSGGAIALRSLGRISVTGSLSALGGDGGKDGGAGGDGRVRLEDSVGSFAAGTIAPGFTTGAFSTSTAVSKWIRVQKNGANATNPTFLAILAKGTGSSYAVDVEGADDAANAPDASTSTGFTTDARTITGKEWVRFRVTLKPGTGPAPAVERVYLPVK